MHSYALPGERGHGRELPLRRPLQRLRGSGGTFSAPSSIPSAPPQVGARLLAEIFWDRRGRASERMLLIPAIDLRAAAACGCCKGDFAAETRYDAEPQELLARYRGPRRRLAACRRPGRRARRQHAATAPSSRDLAAQRRRQAASGRRLAQYRRGRADAELGRGASGRRQRRLDQSGPGANLAQALRGRAHLPGLRRAAR